MYKPIVIITLLVLVGYSILTLDKNAFDDEVAQEEVKVDQQPVTINPAYPANRTPEQESAPAVIEPSLPTNASQEGPPPEEIIAWADPCAAFKSRRTCVLMSNHDSVRRTCIWRQKFFKNPSTQRVYEEEYCVAAK